MLIGNQFSVKIWVRDDFFLSVDFCDKLTLSMNLKTDDIGIRSIV